MFRRAHENSFRAETRDLHFKLLQPLSECIVNSCQFSAEGRITLSLRFDKGTRKTMFMAFKIAVPQILGSEFRHYAVFVLSFIAFFRTADDSVDILYDICSG